MIGTFWQHCLGNWNDALLSLVNSVWVCQYTLHTSAVSSLYQSHRSTIKSGPHVNHQLSLPVNRQLSLYVNQSTYQVAPAVHPNVTDQVGWWRTLCLCLYVNQQLPLSSSVICQVMLYRHCVVEYQSSSPVSLRHYISIIQFSCHLCHHVTIQTPPVTLHVKHSIMLHKLKAECTNSVQECIIEPHTKWATVTCHMA